MKKIIIYCVIFFVLGNIKLYAQTDEDAIMMNKQNFCTGLMYNTSSWKNYWEGTLKRNNLNLGKVSNKMVGIMGNYGITNKLNVLVGLPYISTKASAGTLHGYKGVQDISLWLKWMPIEKNVGKGVLSIYTLGGLSTPLTNYDPNVLPLSIGLHSTTLSGRLMADYQLNHFTITASETYTLRSNIAIDQDSYYTNNYTLIESNKVAMPNTNMLQLRTGYRSDYFIAEAYLTNLNTLGGFDINVQGMPFPSNKMNFTNIGINAKWTLKKISGLSFIGGANYVIAGRNVGQSTNINAGVFYVIDFSHHTKKSSSSTKEK